MHEAKEYMATEIIFEPGDRTRYKFIIIDKTDWLIITGNDTRFFGYEFKVEQILKFFETVGKPPEYDGYHKWADKILHKRQDYLQYVIDHMGGHLVVNPFTALAALCAAYLYIMGEL